MKKIITIGILSSVLLSTGTLSATNIKKDDSSNITKQSTKNNQNNNIISASVSNLSEEKVNSSTKKNSNTKNKVKVKYISPQSDDPNAANVAVRNVQLPSTPNKPNYGDKRTLNIVEFNKPLSLQFTFRKAGTQVANIAPSKDSGGGQLWSGPHGHFFQGSVNSHVNPIKSLIWWLQKNFLYPLSLAFHEGWSGTYGSGQPIEQGHAGIDVAYGGNTKIILSEDSWVSEIWANGNLKEVIVVKPDMNTFEPTVDQQSGKSYFFGIAHASYVTSDTVQPDVNNKPLKYIGSKVIKVYYSKWVQASYIDPRTFNETYVNINKDQNVIVGTHNGSYLIFSYDFNTRAMMGYITKDDYNYILSNSQTKTFQELMNEAENTVNNYRVTPHWIKDHQGYLVYVDEKNRTKVNPRGWENHNGNFMFTFGDGRYATKQWIKVDNIWYHMDSNGHQTLYKGWEKYSGKWMYSNGRNGYYTNKWVKINGKWYKFETSGYIYNQYTWYKYGDKWMYCNGDYGFSTSIIQKINSKYYNFDGNGYMK